MTTRVSDSSSSDLSPLRALIEQWRERARFWMSAHPIETSRADAFYMCASELEDVVLQRLEQQQEQRDTKT